MKKELRYIPTECETHHNPIECNYILILVIFPNRKKFTIKFTSKCPCIFRKGDTFFVRNSNLRVVHIKRKMAIVPQAGWECFIHLIAKNVVTEDQLLKDGWKEINNLH